MSKIPLFTIAWQWCSTCIWIQLFWSNFCMTNLRSSIYKSFQVHMQFFVFIPPSQKQHVRVISLQVVSQHWLSSSQAASIPKIDICPLEEHNLHQIEAPAESFIWLCLHIQMITFHTACRILAREIYTSLVVSWVQAAIGFWWARSLYINAGVTNSWDWHACKIISKLLLSQYYNLLGIECAVFSNPIPPRS